MKCFPFSLITIINVLPIFHLGTWEILVVLGLDACIRVNIVPPGKT
jgi:hypothetical protein